MAGPSNPLNYLIDPKRQIGLDNSDIPQNTDALNPELSNTLRNIPSSDIFNNNNDESIGKSRNSAPPPRRTAASTIKEKLLKPALTSHFECHFNTPKQVDEWITERKLDPKDYNNQRLITLSCSETALPGSRIATNTLQDDHHGVTERHAYRRQFDETSSFTFYVDAPKVGADHGYKLIWFFEQWKSFIMNEEYIKDEDDVELDEYRWHYRAKFPETYMTDIFITKFERDYDVNPISSSRSTKKYLEYKFLQAYPISINTMPVSYDQSQLLKCTVSFAFSRYIVRRKTYGQSGFSANNPSSPVNPNNPTNPITDPYNNGDPIPNPKPTTIPKPSVNSDSSFRSNLNTVTQEDLQAIEDERRLVRESLQLF